MLSIVITLALATPAFAANVNATAPDPAAAALGKLGQAVRRNDGVAQRAARGELGALGDRALPALRGALNALSDAHVRRACCETLAEFFAGNPTAAEIMALGLADTDAGVRYEAASHLGDFKATSAVPGIRTLLDRPDEPVHIRLAAAKSLAQLGEAQGFQLLFEHATSNESLARRTANVGLKALSGKDLGDFGGYEFGERHHVLGIGAHTFTFTEEPIVLAENRVKRFASAAAFARWLKAERPALYTVLVGDPFHHRK